MNLRPVKFIYYDDGKQRVGTGYFQTWGFRAKDDPNMGNIQWTVAIIELNNGAIMEIDPLNFQFIDRGE